jgi:hypothetical protein
MQTTSLHPLDSVPYLDPIKIPKMGSGRVAFALFTFSDQPEMLGCRFI